MYKVWDANNWCIYRLPATVEGTNSMSGYVNLPYPGFTLWRYASFKIRFIADNVIRHVPAWIKPALVSWDAPHAIILANIQRASLLAAQHSTGLNLAVCIACGIEPLLCDKLHYTAMTTAARDELLLSMIVCDHWRLSFNSRICLWQF